MERNDLKVEEAADIARRYFDSVGTDRSTGYKHFQRWLYERRFHMDANGYYIDPARSGKHGTIQLLKTW